MKHKPFLSMPWYKALNDKLEGEPEWVVNVGLLIIVAVSLWLILRGDRLSRTAWFIYLLSP